MLKSDPDSLEVAGGATSTAPTLEVPTSDAMPISRAAARPIRKRIMHLVRRGHLYMGLFLFPWAILYGVTAFLFNHPTAFSDQPTTSFSRESLLGTPMESVPSPNEQADQVVAKLIELQKPATPYRRVGDAKYAGREFAFATVKSPEVSINVLIDVKNGSGTIRTSPVVEKKDGEKAPFASKNSPGTGGRGRGGRSGGEGGRTRSAPDAVVLESPIHERVKGAVPTVLERNGFPTGEVTVTSVPDLVFPVEADGKTWTASYNSLTQSVTGAPADAKPATELSVRRFLTRLHLAHGYPGDTNAKWFWAIIVDAMAFTMCFWGLSGLFMWWQIKATRRVGLVVMLLSGVAATGLGFAMHAFLTGG